MLHRCGNCRSTRVHTQFVIHTRQVCRHRVRGDAQSCRDLFTAFTPGHPSQDVALALGQAHTLTSLEVVLELISHTTTNEGLAMTAVKDSNPYPTGLKVTDEELAALNLVRASFHGEWNSTTKPQLP